MGKRRRVVSVTDFSSLSVHKAAVAACAGDTSIQVSLPDSSEMVEVARILRNWHWDMRRSQSEEPLKLQCREIVSGVSMILKSGPPYLKEMMGTMEAVKAASSSDRLVLEIARAIALLPLQKASADRLAALISAAEEVARDPNLVGLDKWASKPLDSFEQYVADLRTLFDSIASRPDDAAAALQRPFFTFAASVLTVVLATPVTEDAVRSHVMRPDRHFRWGRRGWSNGLRSVAGNFFGACQGPLHILSGHAFTRLKFKGAKSKEIVGN
jgi:hypothetical protein